MSLSRLEYLFNRNVNQECSFQELEELMQLLAQSGNEAAVKNLIAQVAENTGAELQMPDQVSNNILQNILKADKPVEKTIVVPFKNNRKTAIYWKRVAAAALILMVAGAVYFFIEKKRSSEIAVAAPGPAKILPGGKKAMLTIADGSVIALDNTQNGTITQQGNTMINKKDGLLVYNTANVASNTQPPLMYNTLVTPRGGQYEVMLPDGTKVWLNAASKLRFPTSFPGDQREVELTGEAYFEVAKNKKKPFRVHIGEMQVEVLGTTFNVNAYAEEHNITTSLLEGSVKITKGGLKDLLKPGQQAILNKRKEELKITPADMDEATAWKTGLFQFKGADIAAIMRQVGRWYDVEISYPGKIPVRQFEGKISRQAELSEVLQILELSNIKFTVEGKRIIVH